MSTAYKVLRLPYVPTAVVPEYVPTNYTPASATMDGHLEGIDDALVGGGGGGVSLSNAIPAALGTAAAGTGTAASRDDHVHAMPSAAAVGADPAGTASAAVAAHVAAADPHPGYVLESREGQANGIATLDGSGQVPLSQLGNVAAGLSYQGTWNASANTPTLSDGSGSAGFYYKVSTAGSTALDGVSDWGVGDWVIHNEALGTWEKIDNSEAVASVAGKTGVVTLDAADVSETATKLWLSDTERSKLAGVEALADVTDAANVTTALGSISVTAHSDVSDPGSGAIITSAERSKLASLLAGQTDRWSEWIPLYPGETHSPDTDYVAPFAGTLSVAVYYSGTAPGGSGTALLTVTNATTATTMVNAQDAMLPDGTAIDTEPTTFSTIASTTVAAGDRITASLAMAGTLTPAEDANGVHQLAFHLVYTLTRTS